MKFECKGDVFITQVLQVAKACSKTKSQNYLQDIHLQLDDHQLTLRATNLELFCEKSISVKGIISGSCLLPGETFLRIISTFQSKDITLICEVNDGVFVITTPKGVIEVKTTPYEDFPTLPPQGVSLGNLSKDTLLNLFKEVSFCAATTEIKPEIASVYLYTKDNFIYSVATDSYRLAEKKVNNDTNIELSILIPQKHINDILQILSDEEDDLNFSIYESILSITTSTLTLSIHIITGQFPDYKQLFPKEFLTKVQFNKEELQKTLTLTTFFNEQYSQVECIFTENKTTFHSKNESIGQITHSIQSKKDGEDIEAKYNNRYFLDVMGHINSKELICSFTTAQKAMFIRGIDDVSFTYLLMPLNR